MPEVVPGLRAQDGDDFMQRVFRLFVRGRRGVRRQRGIRVIDRRQMDVARIAAQFDQLLRHLGHRQHKIDNAGADRRLRHALVFGVIRRLHQRQATLFLEPGQSDGAVGAGAREHDADRAFTVGVGQRAEKQVDRDMLAARALEIGHAQASVLHRQVLFRRYHINVIFLDRRR